MTSARRQPPWRSALQCVTAGAALATAAACAGAAATRPDGDAGPPGPGPAPDAGASRSLDAGASPDATVGAPPEDGSARSLDAGVPTTPTAQPPVKLAPFVGLRSTPAPGQSNVGFHGADLGWTFQHGTDLRVLFGDSWSDTYATPIGTVGDDAEGVVSLAQFPDGDAVERALDGGAPWWATAAPPVNFVTSAGKVVNITVKRGGAGGTSLSMTLGQVPAGGFGNAGPAHPENPAFAIFSRVVTVPCASADAGGPRCSDGFSCDTGLGLCSGPSSLPGLACVVGSNDCLAGNTCQAVAPGGLCQDTTSSVYRAGDDFGRIESVVVTHEVGNADPDRPDVFYTQPWVTNRFLDPSVRTVEDFDAARADPTQNDYRPADGSHPASEKVLLWGRPNFLGVGSAGLDARLYFAYVDMPSYSATGAFAWKPQYFTGLRNGAPVFSPAPTDAAPLDLHGGNGDTSETWDYVQQMSISYLAPLRRWMMLYGGGASFPAVASAPGSTPTYSHSGDAVDDPQGAIHVRFAVDPWGPWSSPEQHLVAGDPRASPPTLEYAPGGMLHDGTCAGADCAPGEGALPYAATPWGWLYGPNIIDPWTTARADGGADVYWTVSTWSPYSTVLLKSHVAP